MPVTPSEQGTLWGDCHSGDLHPAEAAYYQEIAVHRGWHAAAERAMAHLANSGEDFTADDLRRLLHDCPAPHTPNAYGGLMMTWSGRGLIRKTGYRQSGQVRRRGGVNAVWRGV